uniref:Uncharacterized protein n=1 Tax=Chromera velia CCMP2878 TaxID=1169474 RepID=A0A0G4FL43_9ALVE|eukprot:Cvel_3487.t1-p1 / transcript=Cvel_3487.t1 / gene=Cvel_3487 / organism=Chromera_velia_CCMP2878 / gene_product=hypothetical protein / transcript_product=hypothetical protein / location=Cvel_scaffold140:124259-125274(+) / protein_length=132 / sequence_SO=supercontig / SO=protein_coding / is_pseudo=false
MFFRFVNVHSRLSYSLITEFQKPRAFTRSPSNDVSLHWLFQRLSSGPYRPSWECSLSGGWCWVGSLAEGKGNGGAKPSGAVRFELVTRPAGGFAPQVNGVIRWVSPDGPGHRAGGGPGGGGGTLPRGPKLLV